MTSRPTFEAQLEHLWQKFWLARRALDTARCKLRQALEIDESRQDRVDSPEHASREETLDAVAADRQPGPFGVIAGPHGLLMQRHPTLHEALAYEPRKRCSPGSEVQVIRYVGQDQRMRRLLYRYNWALRGWCPPDSADLVFPYRVLLLREKSSSTRLLARCSTLKPALLWTPPDSLRGRRIVIRAVTCEPDQNVDLFEYGWHDGGWLGIPAEDRVDSPEHASREETLDAVAAIGRYTVRRCSARDDDRELARFEQLGAALDWVPDVEEDADELGVLLEIWEDPAPGGNGAARLLYVYDWQEEAWRKMEKPAKPGRKPKAQAKPKAKSRAKKGPKKW